MKRNKAFTLTELIVVVIAILTFVSLFIYALPSLSRQSKGATRAICASGLSLIHKAMYTYSITNRNKFPRYSDTALGNTTPEESIKGFQVRDRSRSGGDMESSSAKLQGLLESGDLASNGTAALFMMVRDGSASTKYFICPRDEDDEADPLTQIAQPGKGYIKGKPGHLKDIYDFGQPESISYSFINMYNKQADDNWSANAPADWVLMSDDNNATAERKYFKDTTLSPQQLARSENTQNHLGEGQNILFGDGHVKFVTNPFYGPSGDNVMAAGPPSKDDDNTPLKQPLRNNDGLIREEDKNTDVVLISISAKDEDDNYRDWSLASTQKKN